jgi:hypothetical protein
VLLAFPAMALSALIASALRWAALALLGGSEQADAADAPRVPQTLTIVLFASPLTGVLVALLPILVLLLVEPRPAVRSNTLTPCARRSILSAARLQQN